jgi:hypothetical protein
MISSTKKAIWYSVGHLVVASIVYRHLVTGGWLTAHYQLNDPNIVNLVLAIFEAIAVIGVAAFWIGRTQFLAKLLARLFLGQVVIGLGFLAFILFFFFTWRPKLM